MSMKYSGQQIRITLKTGDVKIYRGDAYSVEVYRSKDPSVQSFVAVYLNNNSKYARFEFDDVLEVSQGQYMSEVIY